MIICANFAKKVPVEELFPLAKDLGFKYMQFSFVHFGINDDNPLINDTFLEKAAHLNDIAKNNSLTFPVIHGWLPSTEDSLKVLEIYLKIREILGSSYLVIHPKDKINLDFSIKLIGNHRSKNVILIENVAEPEFKMGLTDVNQITKTGINICFDTCHALEKNLDIHRFLTKYKKSIKVVHLSDFDGEKRHLSIGSSKITTELVNELPNDIIVVFEHKAKSPEEYRESYGTSLNRFREYRTD
ncbi:MAG: TIM barrel protein [Nanoarchaeota archaeon]